MNCERLWMCGYRDWMCREEMKGEISSSSCSSSLNILTLGTANIEKCLTSDSSDFLCLGTSALHTNQPQIFEFDCFNNFFTAHYRNIFSLAVFIIQQNLSGEWICIWLHITTTTTMAIVCASYFSHTSKSDFIFIVERKIYAWNINFNNMYQMYALAHTHSTNASNYIESEKLIQRTMAKNKISGCGTEQPSHKTNENFTSSL